MNLLILTSKQNVAHFDIDVLLHDINVLRLDINVLQLDIIVLLLDINVLLLDINVLLLDIIVLLLDINVLLRDSFVLLLYHLFCLLHYSAHPDELMLLRREQLFRYSDRNTFSRNESARVQRLSVANSPYLSMVFNLSEKYYTRVW
jgi:hypothetical protein